MSYAATTFLVLAVVVVLFVWNRLAVEIVAIGSALALYFTGVLTLEQILSGFGNSTVVFIATLFVVSEGLDATGVTTWAGQELNARAGESRSRLLILMMGLVAFLTALIDRTCDAAEAILDRGIRAAMNDYNGDAAPSKGASKAD